jgi:hypothetical protein
MPYGSPKVTLQAVNLFVARIRDRGDAAAVDRNAVRVVERCGFEGGAGDVIAASAARKRFAPSERFPH